MPLGQVIAEMVDDVRDRVEVSWHHETWHVTAGSFEAALAYVDERFDDPVVLSRRDHGRRWTRVTLDVTEDPDRAPDAPSLAELAEPPAPPEPPGPSEPVAVAQPVAEPVTEQVAGPDPVTGSEMPLDLEEIFAHQNTRSH
jgi:hypothetical protein